MKIQKNHQVAQLPGISASNNAEAWYAHQESRTAVEIQSWLAHYLADLLEIDEIDVRIPFNGYGLDSAAAICMIGDLETWLGRELDPTLPYDFPTIETLAQHLSSNQ